MSLDVASEDYWGATTRCTSGERCQFMFNNEFLSDVKFVARHSRGGIEHLKKIPAHKFLLAISSPVFYAMFYGHLAETKDSIDIPDCEYESLLELFRFIYSDDVNLTPNNVRQVLYLAKKYKLPALSDKCTEYLREKLDASNVFHVLPDAKKYEEKDLVEHCWEVIDQETEEAVKSDGFVTIERSTLEELVERDALNVKEVELFKAVDCWATKECEKQGLTTEGPVKRRVLGERIVRAIRFPLMEEKEFANVVLDCDILTKKESSDMVKYYSSDLKFPVPFSEAKRVGCHQRISRFGSAKKLEGWCYKDSSFEDGKYDWIVLSVSKGIKLHGVRLFGSENNEYEVRLQVSLYSDLSVVSTKTGTFMSKLVQSEGDDYYGFDIVFKPPIVLQAETEYCFETYIIGPPSWYGQGGVSRIEHSGTFFFIKVNNFYNVGRTTFQEGQFSGFEFTLI